MTSLMTIVHPDEWFFHGKISPAGSWLFAGAAEKKFKSSPGLSAFPHRGTCCDCLCTCLATYRNFLPETQ